MSENASLRETLNVRMNEIEDLKRKYNEYAIKSGRLSEYENKFVLLTNEIENLR